MWYCVDGYKFLLVYCVDGCDYWGRVGIGVLDGFGVG